MKVYLVRDAKGSRITNRSTGTRLWTRKHNAIECAKRESYWRPVEVVEFDLTDVEGVVVHTGGPSEKP